MKLKEEDWDSEVGDCHRRHLRLFPSSQLLSMQLNHLSIISLHSSFIHLKRSHVCLLCEGRKQNLFVTRLRSSIYFLRHF